MEQRNVLIGPWNMNRGPWNVIRGREMWLWDSVMW